MTNQNFVTSILFKDDMVYLLLADGRTIGNPIHWHPWLLNATPDQRANVEFYELSAYWPDLDDGLDVDEMMKGIPPRLAPEPSQIST
jgi:hypothetical protein